MNKKLMMILMLVLATFVNADVPPDPGEMRVSANLNITTEADLSDYRFFVDFNRDLKEVEIKSKSSTIIEPMGGGARYRSGTLIAIPQKWLKDLPEKPTNEQLSTLSKSIQDKTTESIELVKHQFSNTIKLSQRANWTYPTYQIERTGDNLKMVKLNDISPKISLEEEAKIRDGGIDFSIYGISNGLTPLGYIVVIGFPTAAIIILGIWLFRRKGRKLG